MLTPPPLVYDSSDDLGERMKKYEEWIHAAKVKHPIFSGVAITEPRTRNARK
jgi:hypothetical protein